MTKPEPSTTEQQLDNIMELMEQLLAELKKIRLSLRGGGNV